MTAPQATLLAALIALAGVTINVVSAQLIRWQDKRAKQREWQRDKLVRDVEEMIPALSQFMVRVSQHISSLDAVQSVETWLLTSNMRDLEAATNEEGMNFLYNYAAENLDEGYRKMREENAVLLALSIELGKWFRYSARRLSIWFEERGEVEERLEHIGQQFDRLCMTVYHSANSVEVLFQRLRNSLTQEPKSLTQEDVDTAQRLSAEFEKAADKQSDLEKLVLDFQADLADRFKTKSERRAIEHSEDGLLVFAARRAEGLVRRLLRALE